MLYLPISLRDLALALTILLLYPTPFVDASVEAPSNADLGPQQPAGPRQAVDPLQPASSGGAAVVDDALARLATHRRLLMIAAHPDDEDTFALAHVARAQGGEAAYLSLTRGDGGQNLIGEELGIGLGLLRSRELESARAIDGARQFFSRAYDFGYTRSLEETLERWPKAVLLEDAERVVRRFAPQVVVAIFPPDARAGHGQHQASGWVATEIFRRSQLGEDWAPSLTAEGLEPWPLEAFFWSSWWDPEAGNVFLDLGELDTWSGRSIYQIALASRSRHRCQDMGFEQPPGDFVDALVRSEGGTAGAPDLFAGIDTSLAAMVEPLADSALRRRLAIELETVQHLAVTARQQLVPSRLDAMVEPLAEIVRRLDAVARQLESPRSAKEKTGHLTVRRLVAEKLSIARDGLAAAAGVVVDAITDRPILVAGDTMTIRSLFWNAGSSPVEGLEVDLVAADDFEVVASAPAEKSGSRFATQLTDQRRLDVRAAADTAPTVPYFLRRPKVADLYDWTETPGPIRALPFEPPPMRLRFRFDLAGAPMALSREVVHRRRDQALGEVRRPLRVVPAVEVTLDRDLIVWPLGRRSDLAVRATVRSNRDTPVKVSVHAALSGAAADGWAVTSPVGEVLIEPHGQQSVEVQLRAPVAGTIDGGGRFALAVHVRDDSGATYDRAFELVDYPHVRPVARPVVARATVVAGTVALPDLQRVGYVRGASDRVPEALAAVGVPIEMLGPDVLAEADLSAYDVVVIGSRAYETEPALVAANARFLDYVRAGGVLIVQYQQYAFVRRELAARPLSIARPHGRVTDETAAMRALVPDHPVFHRPNPLVEADWQGWVQERGLYFADSWDPIYSPVMAFTDPGQPEQQGALLIAPWGEGTYIYTGLAFFRQLPAGVLGAYRLFANLLASGDGG